MTDSKSICVLGATGRVGTRLVRELNSRQWKVIAASRSAETANAKLPSGIELRQVSLVDPVTLLSAIGDSRILFYVYSSDPRTKDQKAFNLSAQCALSEALAKSKVERVINLSSVNVIHGEKAGPPKWLGEIENCLNQMKSVEICHLRSCFFEENITDFINGSSALKSPIESTIPFYSISIGRVVESALSIIEAKTALSKIHEVWGEGPRTAPQLIKSFCERTGVPVPRYEQIEFTEYKTQLSSRGFSDQVISDLLVMHQGINSGLLNQRVISK